MRTSTAMTLLIKRGLEANLPSNIQSGELIYTLDKRRLYVGSGSSGGGYEIEFNKLTSSGQFISNPSGLTRATFQGLGSVVAGNASTTYQVAGGTPTAITSTLNGHYASTQFQSYGGSTWSTTARILMQAGLDHNENSRPTNIIFSTVPSGSTTLVDRLKINGVGVFVSGSLGLTGSLVFSDGTSLSTATLTTAQTASYVDWSGVSNKPSLVSSSLQFKYTDTASFGKLAIGNISPNYPLTVTGSVRIDNGTLYMSGTGNTAAITKDRTNRFEIGGVGGNTVTDNPWWQGMHIVPPDSINITGQGTVFPRVSHYWSYATASNPTDLGYFITTGNYSGYNVGMTMGTLNSGSLNFMTYGTNRIVIDTQGKVAIGNNTAYDFLDVFGSTTIRGNLAIQGNYSVGINSNDSGWHNFNVTNGAASAVFGVSGTETIVGNYANGNLVFVTSGSRKMTIAPDGNIVATNGVTAAALTSSASNLGTVTASSFYGVGAFQFGGSPTDVHTFQGSTQFTGSISINSPITSSVTTGNAPFLINSTTVVTNLNADLVDGYQPSVASSANSIVLRDANGAITSSVLIGTASYALVAATASYVLGQSATSSYALTSSFSLTPTMTSASLASLGSTTSNALGVARCSDCINFSGIFTGSLVYWDNNSLRWRLPSGQAITTTKDAFFAEVMATGQNIQFYNNSGSLFADLIGETRIMMWGGMDPAGGSYYSNGGIQHMTGNRYISGPYRRGYSGDGAGMYIFNNASAYIKLASVKVTKNAGYGISQAFIPAAYNWNAANPHAFFVGWSNLSNGSGAVDTTMIGWLFDPTNITGMGATVSGATTKMARLVRSGSVLVSNLSTDSGAPMPSTASYNFYNVELKDAHTCSFWYGTTEAVGTKTDIISAGINTNGLSPVMALWKGTTTTAEVYVYPGYAKAMMDY